MSGNDADDEKKTFPDPDDLSKTYLFFHNPSVYVCSND